MENNKKSIILLFILLALPIPFSLISWIGTLMSVVNIGMTNWSEFSEFIQGAVALITMFLAGTYLVTYFLSLKVTLKNKRISLISLSPIFHIALFGIFLALWMGLNAIYQV